MEGVFIMKILVVNCGSSSLKYQLIDMENEQVLAKGKCDRIGLEAGIGMPFIEYTRGKDSKITEELELPNHTVAFKKVVEYLTDKEVGAISSLEEINAIGHRIVHGGPSFTKTVLVTDEVMEEYQKSIAYAPLHNPAHLQGINACKEIMPNIPNALVFDTAFHQTMPEHAYLYGIPYEYYEKYAIRRYGAHGTSHKYIAQKTAELLGKNKEDLNIISCHLGNGSSICAIEKGKCVETSMGLTPLEGLIMGTRSGDLDPAVLEFIMERENISINEMLNILNKKSGLLGITGSTSDIRDLKELCKQGNRRAELALDMLCHRIRKYIGAYMAVLGHVDVITFEGGIGEHNPDILEKCVSGLEEFGIKFDNSHIDDEMYEGVTSTPDSRIKMIIIPTNEELMIAKETMELL